MKCTSKIKTVKIERLKTNKNYRPKLKPVKAIKLKQRKIYKNQKFKTQKLKPDDRGSLSLRTSSGLKLNKTHQASQSWTCPWVYNAVFPGSNQCSQLRCALP